MTSEELLGERGRVRLTAADVCDVIARAGIVRTFPGAPLPSGPQIFESSYYQDLHALPRLLAVALHVLTIRRVLMTAALCERM